MLSSVNSLTQRPAFYTDCAPSTNAPPMALLTLGAMFQLAKMTNIAAVPLAVLGLLPAVAWGVGNGAAAALDLTHSAYGIAALVVFITAYALVIGEEFLHLRKS